MKFPFNWGVIGLIVSAISLGVDYMRDKEEEEAREKELNDLNTRITMLENNNKEE